MGDSGGGTPVIYSSDSSGLKERLVDWQKTQPTRQQRDTALQTGVFPQGSILGRPAYEQANAYEDSLLKQISDVSATEQALAQANQLRATNASNAERNQQLSRQQAIEGTQSAGGIVTRAAAPVGPGLPSSILSSPLGVPGGYQFTGKSLLGS